MFTCSWLAVLIVVGTMNRGLYVGGLMFAIALDIAAIAS